MVKARRLLDDSADSVRCFVLNQQDADGGFCGRSRNSDLYYTVFAMEILIALECPAPIERVHAFLRTFDHGQALDLVHLASLARCWADLADCTGRSVDTHVQEGMIQRMQGLRCSDGGFSTNASDIHGNAYGCFLALTMCQDLGIDLPEPELILKCLKSLATDDGGFANMPNSMLATTPSTAAALCVHHILGHALPEDPAVWLMHRIHSQGGFCAIAGEGRLNLPDLLSTATALQALSYSRLPLQQPSARHLDFLDSLWDPRGGFGANWADPAIDCEYTYYGILSLGHLAHIS